MSFYVCVNLAMRHNTTVKLYQIFLLILPLIHVLLCLVQQAYKDFWRLRSHYHNTQWNTHCNNTTTEMLTNTVLPIFYQLLWWVWLNYWRNWTTWSCIYRLWSTIKNLDILQWQSSMVYCCHHRIFRKYIYCTHCITCYSKVPWRRKAGVWFEDSKWILN